MTDDVLIGVAEIEAMCGLDRMQIRRLLLKGEFPEPVVTLRRGRVWHKPKVEKAIAQLRESGRLDEQGRIVPRYLLKTGT
jgi:predicted DNA-binding transcriptional regulator AlpA